MIAGPTHSHYFSPFVVSEAAVVGGKGVDGSLAVKPQSRLACTTPWAVVTYLDHVNFFRAVLV